MSEDIRAIYLDIINVCSDTWLETTCSEEVAATLTLATEVRRLTNTLNERLGAILEESERARKVTIESGVSINEYTQTLNGKTVKGTARVDGLIARYGETAEGTACEE